MSKWNNIKIGNFLYERVGIYKPNNPKVKNLKRLQKIDFAGNIHLVDKKSKTNMIIIKQGDFVISGINVSKGALAVYEGEEDVTATIHYSSYTYNKNEISIDFLKLFLKSPKFIQLLKNQVKGGIKTEIKPKHILPLEIKLPDKSEQEKIVNIFNNIEKNMADLNNEIINQQSLIKHLRQTILQEVVEGKLTADWREKHPELISGENSAESLLKRIKKGKEQLIREKKVKRSKKIQNIITKRNLRLPDGWIYCKADEIFFITKLAGFEYTKYVNLKKSGEIPVIRAQNVRPLSINKKNLLYIDKLTSNILDRSALTKPCLLITFIGAGIGDIATFDESIRWHLAPNVAKMELFTNESTKLNLRYINYFLLSKSGRNEIFKHIKATAQPSLSMGTIRDIDLIIPSLLEQQAIVERVDNLMNIVSKLKKQVIERKEQTAQLMYSVLREAFEQK